MFMARAVIKRSPVSDLGVRERLTPLVALPGPRVCPQALPELICLPQLGLHHDQQSDTAQEVAESPDLRDAGTASSPAITVIHLAPASMTWAG